MFPPNFLEMRNSDLGYLDWRNLEVITKVKCCHNCGFRKKWVCYRHQYVLLAYEHIYRSICDSFKLIKDFDTKEKEEFLIMKYDTNLLKILDEYY
jgi:hypothetical protein